MSQRIRRGAAAPTIPETQLITFVAMISLYALDGLTAPLLDMICVKAVDMAGAIHAISTHKHWDYPRWVPGKSRVGIVKVMSFSEFVQHKCIQKDQPLRDTLLYSSEEDDRFMASAIAATQQEAAAPQRVRRSR